WLKGRFLLLKILKRTKKRSRFLKKEILIVFIHLEASFFPDTFDIKLWLLPIGQHLSDYDQSELPFRYFHSS
ncbi:hypothetical protein AAA441_09035, partial [Lactobacillus crispatus]|uniref:hypothetical protein n=1 Tax=Lactobacillus crispatus TaxID=47770 RepID=UPI001E452CF7